MNAIEKIEEQQKQLTENSAPWVVGEQLKDICRADARCAELVAVDLDNEDMSLKKCEAKIKACADSHKTGRFAYVSPQIAEGIIREFYGLPGAGETPKAPAVDEINLDDYL